MMLNQYGRNNWLSKLRLSYLILLVAGIVLLLMNPFARHGLQSFHLLAQAVPTWIWTVRKPSFTPILPPSYPLAVRNPYLSAWLPGIQTRTWPYVRPQFWTGVNLTWSILARVDNQNYDLFGVPESEASGSQPATLLSGHYTSTHTIFELRAGEVKFTLDFFSPVSPKDYLRQSLPFSYLTVSASVPNGSHHSIQVYSDIDETWTGQSGRTISTYRHSGNVSFFDFKVDGVPNFREVEGMALWGHVIWSAKRIRDVAEVSAATGSAALIRGEFKAQGSLVTLSDTALSEGPDSLAEGEVAGFAQDLGLVTQKASAMFAVGYVRKPAINYLREPQMMYYQAVYENTMAALIHFYNDYEDALEESQRLDQAIEAAGISSAGSKYADILALSTRQIFGGMDLTVSRKTWDTNNPFMFVKECSSDGNIQTVDIIYPTFPFFYLFNPEYIRLMLEPIVQYLATGRYTEPFAIHDLGANYPKATGHDDLKEEKMPLEESGNLLILVNAYVKATGNTKWLDDHFSLFQGYADYLVEKGLYPERQYSTNDALGEMVNHTNLAIKAAVGLTAWGNITNQMAYTDIGKSYASQIEDIGTNKDKEYFTIKYGVENWFLVFNLYPDRLLSLGTFSEDAHKMASDTYRKVRSPAGVAMHGKMAWAKTDWQIFSAGAVLETETRDMFIKDLWDFINNGLNTEPFSDRYWVKDKQLKNGDFKVPGLAHGFRNRPTLGAHFAVLALQGPNLDY